MKRKIGAWCTALGAASGITFLWIDASQGLTHDQGVAAAVSSGLLLLAGGLTFE